MKTKAVRLYGESDLRLEEFDMGELKDDEILMELITDSVCMSTYKESIQGAKHQRVNDDISEHPIIVGHECAGIIREVGAKWKDKYKVYYLERNYNNCNYQKKNRSKDCEVLITNY